MTRCLAPLCLVSSLLLAGGCDKGDEPTDTMGGIDTDSGEDSAGATDGESGESPDAGVGFELCETEGTARSCGEQTGERQYCDYIQEADDLAWGPCMEASECEPGDQLLCPGGQVGMQRCELDEGVPRYSDAECVEDQGGSTPLVIVPRGHSVEYTPAGTMAFDTFSGQCLQHDWPTAQTPWLALDRDRSGFIEDGRELFGSGTFLASGGRAANGFEALAEFDANHDGVIDRKDPVFSQLVLWADENGDRRSSPGELTSLKDAQIRRLPVKFEKDLRCDGRGNCEFERASAGRNHTIVDIHLACR